MVPSRTGLLPCAIQWNAHLIVFGNMQKRPPLVSNARRHAPHMNRTSDRPVSSANNERGGAPGVPAVPESEYDYATTQIDSAANRIPAGE